MHRLEDAELEDCDIDSISSVQDFLAFFKRAARSGQRQGGQGGRRSAPPRSPPSRDSRDRPPQSRPQRCPNCGGEHPKQDCKKPPVPMNERRCWSCNECGHTSNRCPKKNGQKGMRVGNVESEDDLPCFGMCAMVVDEEGYQKVQRGTKPRPRGATVADFMDKNTFAALNAIDEESEGEDEIPELVADDEEVAPRPAPRPAAVVPEANDEDLNEWFNSLIDAERRRGTYGLSDAERPRGVSSSGASSSRDARSGPINGEHAGRVGGSSSASLDCRPTASPRACRREVVRSSRPSCRILPARRKNSTNNSPT